MTYEQHGAVTSAVEVTNVSPHGLWMLLDDREVFLSYDQFPWFREATIGKVVNVEVSSPSHLYWPELDVDLEVESILFPERFPLMSRVHETGEGYVAGESTKGWGQDKIDEAVLALLQLTLHDGDRAWKGFDFEVMDRLFEKGYILDPCGKSKSVVLTREGLERSRELFERLFVKK
jgi:Domain of unknown function (DUF6429)/Protein of unknown function (DUF2442)